MKYKFEVGESVKIAEGIATYGYTNHSGEIGFIIATHPYAKGYEPLYEVEFGNGDIQPYYDYELLPERYW